MPIGIASASGGAPAKTALRLGEYTLTLPGEYHLTDPEAASCDAVTGTGPAEAAAAAGVLPPIDTLVPFELEPMRKALRRAAAHQNSGRIVIPSDGQRVCGVTFQQTAHARKGGMGIGTKK